MQRRIFIGDIQGCREELERLLEEIRFDPAADRLEPVGDLVNRGPDSAGCLRLLASLDAGGVLGNHDLALLATARGTRPERKSDTFGDVLRGEDRVELLGWLASRPFVRPFEDLVLVHGGFSPAWKDPIAVLLAEDPNDPGPAASAAVTIRFCDPEGNLARGMDPAPPPYRPWHELFDRTRVGGRTVVFGHWARQGLLLKPGFRGLDSGCVWGGKLTGWIAEEDRIVQVDARRAYAGI